MSIYREAANLNMVTNPVVHDVSGSSLVIHDIQDYEEYDIAGAIEDATQEFHDGLNMFNDLMLAKKALEELDFLEAELSMMSNKEKQTLAPTIVDNPHLNETDRVEPNLLPLLIPAFIAILATLGYIAYDQYTYVPPVLEKWQETQLESLNLRDDLLYVYRHYPEAFKWNMIYAYTFIGVPMLSLIVWADIAKDKVIKSPLELITMFIHSSSGENANLTKE